VVALKLATYFATQYRGEPYSYLRHKYTLSLLTRQGHLQHTDHVANRPMGQTKNLVMSNDQEHFPPNGPRKAGCEAGARPATEREDRAKTIGYP